MVNKVSINWRKGLVVKSPYGFEGLVVNVEQIHDNEGSYKGVEVLFTWLCEKDASNYQIVYPCWGDSEDLWTPVKVGVWARVKNWFRSVRIRRLIRKTRPWIELS
jgi:hypothetical protein